jgi:hypothetical protein
MMTVTWTGRGEAPHERCQFPLRRSLLPMRRLLLRWSLASARHMVAGGVRCAKQIDG